MNETMRRPRVYVPNKGGHNFSAASRYGDIVYLSEGMVNKFQLGSFYRSCADLMRDAEPHDYLIITSLNSLCSIAAAVLARKFGRLNLLLFRADTYVERKIDIDSLLFPDGNTEISNEDV